MLNQVISREHINVTSILVVDCSIRVLNNSGNFKLEVTLKFFPQNRFGGFY